MEKCLNKKAIYDFVSLLEKSFFCECVIDEAKELFTSVISNDKSVINNFFTELKDIKISLFKDLKYFTECDPACDSEEEIIECYPGFKAITYYRIAHILFKLNLKLFARVITEKAHVETGIDIHPGAQIGCPFFIDHGTGIVIGETTIIGDNVRLYQGVTLGALSLEKGSKIKGVKRHPTIGNNVIIYANASILGGDVKVGNNVVIGGNVFLTESIPDNHKVILRKPELVLIKK